MTEPVWNGPGKLMYEAFRDAHNADKNNIAFAGRLPRWKNLKPRQMRLWNTAALNLRYNGGTHA